MSASNNAAFRTTPKSAGAVVIGSGIQGLCCAYSLIRREVKPVIVLESGSSAGGRATQRSAAMLTRFTGHPATNMLADRSVSMYKELASELASETGVDVEFTWCGYAILGRGNDAMTQVRTEHRNHVDLGFDPIPEIISGSDLNELSEGLFTFPADALACYAYRDGFVNIGTLTSALSEYIRIKGGAIIVNTPAVGIDSDGSRVRGVRTSSGIIETRSVVNAAGISAGTVSAWVNRRVHIQPSKKTLVQILNLGRRFSGPIVECLDDGWYFRPDSRSRSNMLLVGVGFGEARGSHSDLLETEPDVDQGAILACQEYLRMWSSVDRDVLNSIALRDAWSGYRPVHIVDDAPNLASQAHAPLFGKPTDTIDGYYESCGAGEFGVIFGPVSGFIVAAEVVREGLLLSE